jgi:signal transduction protein with GAF and PtsI domain
MQAQELQIQGTLNGLRAEVGSDLSALAIIDRRERYSRWKWVSGNLNERYLNISVRYGQGIEGEVIKVGRGLAWSYEESKKHAGYSIILTERLVSAYAVPVMEEREIAGILLVGDRTQRAYEASQRQAVTKAAAEIAERFPDLL